MRKHARSWLIKVALGGIIVVFVFWYGSPGSLEAPQDYVAEVNGAHITFDHFRLVLESRKEQIRLRFGGNVPPGMLKEMNLDAKIVAELVNQVLLLQEAERLGLEVTDEQLIADIRSNSAFHRDNQFDETVYRAVLRKISLDPASYEFIHRRELQERQMVNLLTDGVKTDPKELKRLWHFQNDKLKLEMLVVPAKTDGADEEPDPQELADYFQEHASRYTLPPTADVKFTVISWPELVDQVTVSDEALKRYFSMHPEEAREPEKVKIGQILVKVTRDASEEQEQEARARVEQIQSRLEAGDEFAAVAKEESDHQPSRSQGGDLGFMTRETMNPEFAKVVFDMDEGGISEPVRTDAGYHILMVQKKQPAKELAFEDVRDDLRQRLVEREARDRVETVAEEFYEQVYRSENLEQTAQDFGLDVRTARSVTEVGGLPGGNVGSEIMEPIFELAPGRITPLIRHQDSYIVAKVLDKTEERLPTLDEIRDQVVKNFREARAKEQARKTAQEIIERLKDTSQSAKDAAQAYGLEWKPLEAVSRTAGLIPELGNAPAVSDMLTSVSETNRVYADPLSVGSKAVVVRLTDVEPASDARYAEEADTFRQWILEVRRTEFLTGWLEALKERSTIQVNDKFVERRSS
jgi:peptidyl-prolyl cis-trans isomerase D